MKSIGLRYNLFLVVLRELRFEYIYISRGLYVFIVGEGWVHNVSIYLSISIVYHYFCTVCLSYPLLLKRFEVGKGTEGKTATESILPFTWCSWNSLEVRTSVGIECQWPVMLSGSTGNTNQTSSKNSFLLPFTRIFTEYWVTI